MLHKNLSTFKIETKIKSFHFTSIEKLEWKTLHILLVDSLEFDIQSFAQKTQVTYQQRFDMSIAISIF